MECGVGNYEGEIGKRGAEIERRKETRREK